MNPLYQLNLDFAKGLNFTKAIMARQGDAGVLVEVHPFMKGVQVVPTGYTFTMKGTTPSGRYVDAVGTIKDNIVEFKLDGRFLSEAGYYSNCYVEMSKGDTLLTSQDIIFFSLKVSDITQGQGAEYVSRLEQLLKDFRNEFDTLLLDLNSQFNELKIKTDELITEYNKQLADALAKFQKDIQDSLDKLTATANDLEGRYTQLDELANSLDNKVNELKEEISKLGNLQVMYSNSIDLGETGEYKYRGVGMRESDNPEDYVWDLEPKYVENNLATDTKVSEIVSQANEYTDNKVAAVNTSLTNIADDLANKINTNTNNITAISNAMPLFAVYGEGRDLTDSPDGTKIPIGNLIATDFFHTASDLPYRISSDGITLTATRNCVLFFEGSVKLHGNNTFKYAYIKIRKNGSDTNFANVGSSANLNYVTSQAAQYVHTLVTGDKVEFTLGIDASAKMFHLQLLSLKISELKAV